jgi:hypothetical protein
VSADAPPTSSLAASALRSGIALAGTMAATPAGLDAAPHIVAKTNPGVTPPSSPAVRATGAGTLADEDAAPSSKSRAPLWGAIAGLGVVFAGVAAMVAFQSPDGETAAVVAAAPTEATTPPPNTHPTRPPTLPTNTVVTPPVGTGASVTVQITTIPEDAEVYLDGHRIPNPFDGELPQTEVPRTLEVRAAGYTTKAQDLVLSFPQRVRVRLDAGEGVDDRSTRATREGGTTGSSTMRATTPSSDMAGTSGSELPPPPSSARDPARHRGARDTAHAAHARARHQHGPQADPLLMRTRPSRKKHGRRAGPRVTCRGTRAHPSRASWRGSRSRATLHPLGACWCQAAVRATPRLRSPALTRLVVGLDLAPSSRRALRRGGRAGGRAALREHVVGDFFEAPLGAPFELIYDYTFLCALPLALRPRWAARMAALVRPGGTLLCMVFPIITPPPGYQGPPWPLTVADVRALLAADFDVVSETPSEHTHPGREGKECLLELVRKG